MKQTKLLVFFALFGCTLNSNASTVVSITGQDDGGELVSTTQFVAFRWVSDDPHFDVSVFAKLAATSNDVPFVGAADLTYGPCCAPNTSIEIAHSEFTVNSEDSKFIELFQGLTLPPNDYYLTLAGAGPGSGLWVVAGPIAFIMTAPDSGVAGGDQVARAPNLDPLFPPGSQFASNGEQTQFAVTDMGTPIVAEPSSFIPLLGLITLLIVRTNWLRTHSR